MRKILLAVLAAFFAIPSFAGVKLVSGSVDALSGEKNIQVTLNWEKAVYDKWGTLTNFLDLAVRNKTWESASTGYFCQQATLKTAKLGLRFAESKENEVTTNYYFEIVTTTINKDGSIAGELLLKKKGESEPIAVFSFKSDDEDKTDKITFRDQFSSIGKSLGKFIVKQLI